MWAVRDSFWIRRHTLQHLGSCKSCGEVGAVVGVSWFHYRGLVGVYVGGSFQVSLLVDGSSCRETFGFKFYSLVIQRKKKVFFSHINDLKTACLPAKHLLFLIEVSTGKVTMLYY